MTFFRFSQLFNFRHLDKPWSQVSSILPRGACVRFHRAEGAAFPLLVVFRCLWRGSLREQQHRLRVLLLSNFPLTPLLLYPPYRSVRESTGPHTIIAISERASGGRAITAARRRGPRSYPHRGRETPPTGGNNKGRGGGGNLVPVPPLSPVHEAAATGHVETLSLLLQYGSSLEERDTASGIVGDTPLSRAVREGQLDCARVLLDAGAMISRENARG